MGSESKGDHPRLECWLHGVLLLGLFLYVWHGVKTQLLYYGFGVFAPYPVFSWESTFLHGVFTTPGGVLSAVAALLAQTYRLDWLGAVTVTILLGALFAGVRCLPGLKASSLRDLAWVPVILSLMIYTRYDNPLPILLAITWSAWMAVLYQAIPMKTPWRRGTVFLVLFALAYYLIGATAFVFACVVCLIEALLNRRFVAAIVQAVLALGGAFLLGRFVFGLEPRMVYSVGTLWDSAQRFEFSAFANVLTVVLYVSVPALILLAFVSHFAIDFASRMPRNSGRKGSRSAKAAKTDRPTWRDGRLWIAMRAVIVVAVAVACLATSPGHIRDERALHAYSQQRDWDAVIALAHRMRGRSAYTRSAVFDINRALAHAGELGDELCAYPQDGKKGLFLSFGDIAGRFQHVKLLELYLDLGCPNAAEKNVYELLDNEGSSPYVLGAMVRIHLVKGEYESARIALASMKKYAGSEEYVRRWQALVDDSAKADSDPLIQAWRRVQGKRDYAIGGIAFEPLLKTLLQETPTHRLAFEYLMASFLLKHERAELLNYLPLLGPLKYKRLPRHYAEAVLVHSLETRTPPDARGWTLEPDVINQFREITAIVQSAHGDNQAAFDELAPKYGDTYTFFSMFNTCGAK